MQSLTTMQFGLLFSVASLLLGATHARILQQEGRKSETPVPCYLHLCFCQGTVANCSGANLTYIPRVWHNITSVIMIDNLLYNITKTSLKNLTFLKLTDLSLTSNRIDQISVDAFSELRSLRRLYLNKNTALNPSKLMTAFVGLENCKGLHELHIQGIGLQHLPKNMFQSLHQTQLKCLKLGYNNLVSYDQSVFSPLKLLESIFIGYNKIKNANWGYAPSLKNMYIDKNRLSDLNSLCNKVSSYYPNLRELRFDNNLIGEIPKFPASCLPNVEILGLNQIPIRSIMSDTFSLLPRIKGIFLQDIFGAALLIQGFAFNNSHVTQISLKGSNLEIKNNVNKDVFRGCFSLKFLDLSYNSLKGLSEENFCDLIKDSQDITLLKVDSAKLKNISIILNCGLKRLNKLSMHYNSITEVPFNLFTSLPNLTHLKADRNAISTLDERTFPMMVRKRLKQLQLDHNPFACTCDIRWFIQWAEEDQKKFLSYPYEYNCKTPAKYRDTKLSDLKLTDQECLLNKYVTTMVLAVTFAVITMITVFSLIYRWRWHIRYYIYLLKYQGHRINHVGREYRYDCFVVYSKEETNWIIQNLIPNLEDRAGLTLCIDERDFDVGGAIVDNIVENIDISKKVLIVLSNNTLQSEWCQFEINFSHRRSLTSAAGFLVVILKEEIESSNMSNTVRSLLDSNTYITWPEDENEIEARALFWERLEAEIKCDD